MADYRGTGKNDQSDVNSGVAAKCCEFSNHLTSASGLSTESQRDISYDPQLNSWKRKESGGVSAYTTSCGSLLSFGLLEVGYRENRLRPFGHAAHGPLHILRVEGAETFVENEEFRILQQRPGQEDAGAFSL